MLVLEFVGTYWMNIIELKDVLDLKTFLNQKNKLKTITVLFTTYMVILKLVFSKDFNRLGIL